MPGKDTICIQYRLDTMPLLPKADVVITGYSTSDQPVLMKYDATLIAHTPEPRLEAGVPVCYLMSVEIPLCHTADINSVKPIPSKV